MRDEHPKTSGPMKNDLGFGGRLLLLFRPQSSLLAHPLFANN